MRKRYPGWPSLFYHHEFYHEEGVLRMRSKWRPWYLITGPDQITELAILVAIQEMTEDMKDGNV